MNREGLQRCDELQNRKYSASELQDELTRTRMMSILCHCSAEIDQGSLLYFSVHNMFLGTGDYILLLFSEISDPTDAQNRGLDVYSRMTVYHLIEEEAKEILSGHMTLYSAELDGRLVILIQFPYGLLPAHRADLLQQIGLSCCEISENCKNRYDINVVTYISDVMDQISLIAETYHKMLSTATLHRYIHRKFDEPIYRLFRPQAGQESPIQLSIEEQAASAAQAIVENTGYREILSTALNQIASQPFQSTDDLKRHYGELFEALCGELQVRGIRLNISQLREEEMPVIMDDTDWQSPVNWLLEMADSIAASCETDKQATLRENLESVKKFIQDNLTDPNLSVKSISDTLGLSTTALSVMFRQQLKTTPAHYIRDLRLDMASKLLRTTSLTIEEVCNQCGFGSLETFHRAFKDKFGITPGKLRRLSRIQESEKQESPQVQQ